MAFDLWQLGQGADRCDDRVPKTRHLIRGEATMPLPVEIQPPSMARHLTRASQGMGLTAAMTE
ncbi:hypothetical protein QN379_09810, partial [Glaciimonas sp. Gout2]|uniref:hypothetical protein n=1 Tax=Glaciimonas sp. Gout2 TaxID=3048625 RepID=UPI002B23BA44